MSGGLHRPSLRLSAIAAAMRRSGPALLPLLLLAGCAGYAADYWKPKNSLIAAQLPRYGISAEDSRCVGERLTKNLSVWQLRQLADIARRLGARRRQSALAPRDLAYVAGLVQDPKVGPEVAATLAACDVGQPAPAAAPAVAEPAAPDARRSSRGRLRRRRCAGSISAPPRPASASPSTSRLGGDDRGEARRLVPALQSRRDGAERSTPIACGSTAPAGPSLRPRRANTTPTARSPSRRIIPPPGRRRCRSRRGR